MEEIGERLLGGGEKGCRTRQKLIRTEKPAIDVDSFCTALLLNSHKQQQFSDDSSPGYMARLLRFLL